MVYPGAVSERLGMDDDADSSMGRAILEFTSRKFGYAYSSGCGFQ